MTDPLFVRKAGLEPARCSQHKILSLARLPIPTLPHLRRKTCVLQANKLIIGDSLSFVNLKFQHIFKSAMGRICSSDSRYLI